MRNILVLVAVLLVIQSSWALEDYFSIDHVNLDATWSGTLTTSQSAGASLNSLTARINFIPPDAYTTNPNSREENGSIVFDWNRLEPRYEYSVSSSFATHMNGSLLRSEPYPTHDTGRDLAATALIDYNDPTVRAFAANIAHGETDTLRLAVRMADAVRSRIQYNLSSLNIDATYSASDVLARGQGVCDEITVLYIASMRAVGVPARYVSGYAYTNIFDPNGTWEGHSWAEVYIAGQWVPFDLTYGEYIQLSPAHIPIRRSDDAENSKISFTWYGHGVDVAASKLTSDIRVTGVGPHVEFGTLDPHFVHETTGQGWNELDIDVRNELDSFIAPVIEIGRTQGLDMPAEHSVIVPPHSTRTLRIPVHITETLRPRYDYTFPAVVSARGFSDAETAFRANTRAASYAEPTIENESEFHPDLDLTCSNTTGLPGTSTNVTCALHNIGNRNLDLRVCTSTCTHVNVLIGEHLNVSLPVTLPNGTSIRTIRVLGDIRGETNATLTGRAPAIVSVEASADGSTIGVSITSDTPIEPHVAIRSGNASFEGDGARQSYTVPANAFWLNRAASVRVTYDDVDGAHAIERTVTIHQGPIEALAAHLNAWFSKLY